jgi:muramidase (phage lysozyme)
MNKMLASIVGVSVVFTFCTIALAEGQFEPVGFGKSITLIKDWTTLEVGKEENGELYLRPPAFDEDVPVSSVVHDPKYMQDMLWAYNVDITAVKVKHLTDKHWDAVMVLAMRKLVYTGYLPTLKYRVPQVDFLTEKGKVLYKDLERPQVQALLATIRYAEGTYGPDGYRKVFGGKLIKDFGIVHSGDDHGGSSAENAYQFMDYTGPDVAEALGITDGMPLSQDLMALYQIRYKHGINTSTFDDDVFVDIIHRLAPEWASFPCGEGGKWGPDKSCYSFKGKPQPAKSLDELWGVYAAARNENKTPPMGYNYFFWDDGVVLALKGFQYTFQRTANGELDAATVSSLLDGTMGDVVGQAAP